MSLSTNSLQQILSQDLNKDRIGKAANSNLGQLNKQQFLKGQNLRELKFNILKNNMNSNQSVSFNKQENACNNSLKFVKLTSENDVKAIKSFQNSLALSRRSYQNIQESFKVKAVGQKKNPASQFSPSRNNTILKMPQQINQNNLLQKENGNQQDILIKSIYDKFFYTQRNNPLQQNNFQNNYEPYLKQTQNLEKTKQQSQLTSQQNSDKKQFEENQQRINRQKINLDSMDNAHHKSLKLLRLGDQISKNPQLYYLKQSAKQREQHIKSQVSISLSKLYAEEKHTQQQKQNDMMSQQKQNKIKIEDQDKQDQKNKSLLVENNQLMNQLTNQQENNTSLFNSNKKGNLQRGPGSQLNNQNEIKDQNDNSQQSKDLIVNKIFQIQPKQNRSYLYKNKYSINLSQLEMINCYQQQHEILSNNQIKYYKQIQNSILRRNQSQDLNSSKISQGTQTVNFDLEIKSPVSSSPSERNSYIASKNISNLQNDINRVYNKNDDKEVELNITNDQIELKLESIKNYQVQNKKRGNSVIIDHDQSIFLPNNQRRQSFSHLNSSSNKSKKQIKEKEQLSFSKQTYQFLKPTLSFQDNSKIVDRVKKQNSLDQLNHLISPPISCKSSKSFQKQTDYKNEKLFRAPSISAFYNLQKYKQKVKSNKTIQKISFFQSPVQNIQNIEGFKLLMDKSQKLQLIQLKSSVLQQIGQKIVKSKQNLPTQQDSFF